MIVTFRVAGLAQTKGSWIHVGRGKLRPDNPAAASWEQLIAWHAKLAMRTTANIEPGLRFDTPTNERVCVTLRFVLPRPPSKAKKYRRDIDKLARAALDAMSKIVYLDDEQVDEMHVKKRVSDRSTDFGVTITVARIQEEQEDEHRGSTAAETAT